MLIFTAIVPAILLLFRNSEYISSILGRSVTNENYITINLEEDSIFRNLRIMTFRNKIEDFQNINLNDSKKVIEIIDSINKQKNLNLIVLGFNKQSTINKNLETYLIDLNKKVLIIS